ATGSLKSTSGLSRAQHRAEDIDGKDLLQCGRLHLGATPDRACYSGIVAQATQRPAPCLCGVAVTLDVLFRPDVGAYGYGAVSVRPDCSEHRHGRSFVARVVDADVIAAAGGKAGGRRADSTARPCDDQSHTSSPCFDWTNVAGRVPEPGQQQRECR